MRWLAVILAVLDAALGAYLAVSARTPRAPVDVRSLEINAERVRLLQRPGTGAAAEPGVRAAACLEWGSFTAAELERAQAELANLKTAAATVRELSGATAWWVHVPPLRTRDEAERRVREIELAGVSDVRLVAEGERWRNAISLGIFKSEEAASAYLERLRELKVRNAAVTARNDLLRLAVIAIAEPTQAQLARIMELKTVFPGTEVKAAACAGAA